MNLKTEFIIGPEKGTVKSDLHTRYRHIQIPEEALTYQVLSDSPIQTMINLFYFFPSILQYLSPAV